MQRRLFTEGSDVKSGQPLFAIDASPYQAAAAIAPSAGFNRLAFGERHAGVFSSRDAVYHSRLQLGYSGSVKRHVGTSAVDFRRNEAQADFSIDYGLPGSRGYAYTRPFDYFNFQATASRMS